MTSPERFWRMVGMGPNGCWVWLGYKDSDGYGHFHVSSSPKKSTVAHKWLWEHERGPVPTGLTLDHVCRNTSCVRPDHLVIETRARNTSKARALQPRPAHCIRGHEFTAENAYTYPNGERACRECRTMHSRLYEARSGRRGRRNVQSVVNST